MQAIELSQDFLGALAEPRWGNYLHRNIMISHAGAAEVRYAFSFQFQLLTGLYPSWKAQHDHAVNGRNLYLFSQCGLLHGHLCVRNTGEVLLV